MIPKNRPIDEAALDNVLRGFLACQRNPVLYPPEHPLPRRAIEKLLTVLDYFWDLENPFHLTAIEEDVLVNGEISLFKQDDSLRRLEEIFQYHQIKKIVLFKGISSVEFLDLFNRLSFSQPPLLEETDQVRIGEGILLEKVTPKTERLTKDEYNLSTKGAFKLYDTALDAARKMSQQVREEKILYPKEIKAMTWAMVEFFLKRKDIMIVMAQLKDYDDYTYTHSVNVSILTLAQAQSLNLPKKTLFEFALAGLTHDVGKEVVPLSILNKPGKLTDEEFRTIQNHSLEGARILKKTPGMPFVCTIAAFEHQIKYDGSGYPKRQFSSESHLVSWLVTIADVFDALRSTRPYREALTTEKIFSIMRAGEGRDFHPTLLNRFIHMVGAYHKGTLVILNTNAIAIVYKVNILNPQRPLVKVICQPDGTLLAVPYLLNLMERDPGSEQYKWSIQGIFESPHFQVNPLDYL
jgi:HD-GYP domain-containing protein (c-di-GMP phosphodiesterase class II)